MAHVIQIVGSNRSTGLLELSDRGHTEAGRGSRITWQIRDGDVASIEIVQKPGGSDNIWATPPHPQGNHWTAVTVSNVRYHMLHRYAIKWKSSSGTDHIHDPIISMRPSGFDARLAIAFLAGAAFTAVFALLIFHRKNQKDISIDEYRKTP